MLRLDPKQAVLDHVASGKPANPLSVSLSDAAESIVARPVETTYSAPVIVGIAQAMEALMLATLGYAIYESYVGGLEDGFYVPVILGAVLLANIVLNIARTHRIPVYRSLLKQVGRVLASWSVVMLVLSVLAFLFKASD